MSNDEAFSRRVKMFEIINIFFHKDTDKNVKSDIFLEFKR